MGLLRTKAAFFFSIGILIFSGLTFFGAPLKAASPLSGLVLNADEMIRDGTKQQVHLRGHVQVVFDHHHLMCDEATIDLKSKEITARGQVSLLTPTIYMEGEELTINYETKQGRLVNGFVQSGQVVFDGVIIEKVGEREFMAIQGHYTACNTCPPSWSFSGQEMEAEIGGYAYIKHPVLRVVGVPVFYMPRILLPLKSDRQSGLLVPSWNHTRAGGFAFEQSYFWAIDRSQDLTFGLRHYQLRGLKALSDYRYVLSEQSQGQLRGAWLADRVFKNQQNLDSALDRWFLSYRHFYRLPHDFVHRTRLHAVSDLRYPRDFPDEILGHGDPSLENRISLSRNSETHHMSLEASLYVNLLQQEALARNDQAVHRMPQLRYSVVEQRVLGSDLLFAADFDYTHFARTGPSFDRIACFDSLTSTTPVACTGDPGQIKRVVTTDSSADFDPNIDIMRSGQRFDFWPRLSHPLHLGQAVDLVPTLSYRETHYSFGLTEDFSDQGFGPWAARRYLQTDISARTQLSRVFGDFEDPEATRFKHEIEPQILYSHIPWIERPDHGFFGDFEGQRFSRSLEPISDEDFFGANRIQFDYEDRIFDRHLIEFGLVNRLVRRQWRTNHASYRNDVIWRISQSYDLNEAQNENPQPWSSINNQLQIRLNHFETYTTANYYPYAKVTNLSSRVRLKRSRGDFLQVTYRHNYIVTADNTVDPLSRRENLRLSSGIVSRHIDFVGSVDYSLVTRALQAWEYIANIRPPGDCWGIRLGHKQIIGGDIQFNFNFDFKFGG